MIKIFLTIISASVNLSAQSLELKGTATLVNSSAVIYTELHSITFDEKGLNRKIETKYLTPDGKLFAQMNSDFNKNPLIPEVKFTDQRFNTTEEVILDESTNTVTFKSSGGQQQKPKSKDYKIKDQMALGQGFDNFIKLNLKSLKDSSVPLSFGVISEMDFFSFNSYKKRGSSNDIIQIGIDLSSFIYRLFSSELILEYDVLTQQLRSYKGLSNLLSDDGKAQNVFIKYEVLSLVKQ